ncbi:MAG: tRNA (adenosine(37)-N6)-threonylcarbamoyltransferase complex transferase subunit TsaD [Candidatus Berkelbacteria bacterium]|nr:tRNA (adenosine(37)-N6)-threonylcarbamoyltransferase complex transferase subunit TsaD [Candidatus Berkelbacteria bacterium]
MKILGIETSCDETAAAIVEVKNDCTQASPRIKILSNIVSSQIKIHRKYGGVFPELASRAHLENIIPVLKESLEESKTKLDAIDLIAVTVGPGLIGSLLVGVNTAKTIAYTLEKPIIGVNHLEGHVYSAPGGERQKNKTFMASLEAQSGSQAHWKAESRTNKAHIFERQASQDFQFPALVLIVSGGHTSLVLMHNHGDFKIIGQTRDDAAGEAFDKVAALLGLPYPGGPAIERIVQKAGLKSHFSSLKYKLPRPMIDSKDFDFSFSGLKTAVLYLVKQLPDDQIQKVRQQIAAEFQQAVIDVLIQKTLQAAKKYDTKTIILCGGVSANSLLRKEFELKINFARKGSAAKADFYKLKIDFLVPPKNLCTDNAAMIAIAGCFKSLEKKPDKCYNIYADSNAKLLSW